LSTAIVALVYMAFLGLCFWGAVLCWDKGKRTTAVVGLFFFHPVLIIGAIRLAKPDSPKGMSYSAGKFERSCRRYPTLAAYGHNARPLYVG
jgi:hypothetical protein